MESNFPRIVAVAGAKGGVGKTTIAANLAVSLASSGRRVLVFDADLGLANIDVMLGITPNRTIRHIIDRVGALEEIVVPGPAGISIVPASSGVPELAQLPRKRQVNLIAALGALASRYDTVLIDTPAGLGSNALCFARMADLLYVVTTPEPTSITDAYAMVKVLHRGGSAPAMKLIVNMAEDETESRRIETAFGEITQRFLGLEVSSACHLPADACVPLSVKRQVPLVLSYPGCPAARCVKELSTTLFPEPVRAGNQIPSIESGPKTHNRISRWLDLWHIDRRGDA